MIDRKEAVSKVHRLVVSDHKELALGRQEEYALIQFALSAQTLPAADAIPHGTLGQSAV